MHLGLRHAVTSEIQVYSTRPKVLGQAWHMVEGLDPHARGVVEGGPAVPLPPRRPHRRRRASGPALLHQGRGQGKRRRLHGPVRQEAEVPRRPCPRRTARGPSRSTPTATTGSWRCSATRARHSRPASAHSCSGPWPRPSGRPWSTTSSRPAAMTEATGVGGTGCRCAALVVAT